MLPGMKALSFRHPWIDAILAGRKTIEVRTWATRYRGPLLLHASAAWGVSERTAAARLLLPPPEPRTSGALVGAAFLSDCRKVNPEDWAEAGLPPLEGRLFAWVISETEQFEPIPMRGQRRLFDVDDALLPTTLTRRWAAAMT